MTVYAIGVRSAVRMIVFIYRLVEFIFSIENTEPRCRTEWNRVETQVPVYIVRCIFLQIDYDRKQLQQDIILQFTNITHK